MPKLKWTKDGDQYCAKGSLGEYKVSEWTMRHGSEWALSFTDRDGARHALSTDILFSTAKATAQVHNDTVR